MTIKSGFFNSSSGDRKYDALDLSSIFDGIIEDGVFATLDNQFAVKPGTGMQVTVDTGKAWFNHTWTINDAILPLTIEAADITLDRYDAVVLEVNNTDPVRRNDIKIVKGTPAGIPKKPTLVNETDVHQHALAYILVGKGVTSIEARFIEIVVGKSETPFVTGPLKTVPIDELFAQWESEFDYWFENLKGNLEGDVAANLQKQIDERVKIADRATNEELATGTNENKWVSAKGLKDAGFDAAFRVGDTCTTLRSDLGERWALCNGDLISGERYPDFVKLLPPPSSLLASAKLISLTRAPINGSNLNAIYADDRYQIAFIDEHARDDSPQLSIDVSDDNFDTKKNIKLWSNISQMTGPYRVGKFSDGTYVAIAGFGIRNYTMQVKTAKDPKGSWTAGKEISLPKPSVGSGMTSFDEVLDIWDRNGVYYIAVGYGAGGFAIVSSQNSSFSSPSIKLFNIGGTMGTIAAYCRLANKNYAIETGTNDNTMHIVALHEYDSDAPLVTGREISVSTNKLYPNVVYPDGDTMVLFGTGSHFCVGYFTDPASGAMTAYETSHTYNSHPTNVIHAKNEFWILPGEMNGDMMVNHDYKQADGWTPTKISDFLPVSSEELYSNHAASTNSDYLFIILPTAKLIRLPLNALPAIDSAPLRTFIKVKE